MKNCVISIAIIVSITLIGVMVVADTSEKTECVYMESSTSDVLFEGETVCFGDELPIYEKNGATYVPLRAFAQELGKVVEWDESSNEISIKNKQTANAGRSFGSYVYGGDTLPRVSIIQLLANPEKYNEQNVNVEGVISVEFENDRLFLTREDMEYINKANSLGLNIRTSNNLGVPIEELEQISGSFVKMEGTFMYEEGNAYLHDVTYIYCKKNFSN